MTHTECSAPPSDQPTAHRTRSRAHARLRQARIRRALDGVVASYIHEISARAAVDFPSRVR